MRIKAEEAQNIYEKNELALKVQLSSLSSTMIQKLSDLKSDIDVKEQELQEMREELEKYKKEREKFESDIKNQEEFHVEKEQTITKEFTRVEANLQS